MCIRLRPFGRFGHFVRGWRGGGRRFWRRGNRCFCDMTGCGLPIVLPQLVLMLNLSDCSGLRHALEFGGRRHPQHCTAAQNIHIVIGEGIGVSA